MTWLQKAGVGKDDYIGNTESMGLRGHKGLAYIVHKRGILLSVSLLLAVVNSEVDGEEGEHKQDPHVHDHACQVDSKTDRLLPNLAWVGTQLEAALCARDRQACCIAAVLIQQQGIPPLDG